MKLHAGICLILIMVSVQLHAQDGPSGSVFNSSDHQPLAGCSIAFTQSNVKTQTKEDGSFNLSRYQFEKTDSIIFSSVGFKTIKMPIAEASNLHMFYLPESKTTLSAVTVTSYLHSSAEGNIATNAAYFRNWTSNKNGGEIGRILNIGKDNYKIEKVRVKINNQCDTCVLRLRIRGLKNGYPDYELLYDSTSVVAGKYHFGDKFLEIDLRKKNVIIKKHRQIYVGFETLYCNNKKGTTCSLCYIGTEDGDYYYRTKDYEDWQISQESALYMRVFYRF